MNGMRVEADTIDLPAYWASFLVNGDASSLTDDAERERAERVVTDLGSWEIVGIEDDAPRFTWNYRMYDPGATVDGGEVLRYVMIRRS